MIQVLQPGMQTTIQDAGRPGYARFGVSAAGCAIPIAMRIANRLVANSEQAAVLEILLQGPLLCFQEAAHFAIGGADFDAALDGRRINIWQTHHARAGSILKIGGVHSGARCVLAVEGGFAVAAVLGSRSTHLLSQLGGIEGRALQKGDMLRRNRPEFAVRAGQLPPASRAMLSPMKIRRATGTVARQVLRMVPGMHAHLFPPDVFQRLTDDAWRVSQQSNRMGIRLEGPSLPSAEASLLSEGVSTGCIQTPPDGQPIISFVDQQTTGGYGVPACVIAADFDHLGQLRPGEEVLFGEVAVEDAWTALEQREAMLAARDFIQWS
jgi:antagonist of KipI